MKDGNALTQVRQHAKMLMGAVSLLLIAALIPVASSSAAWQKAGDEPEKSITGQWVIEALDGGESLSAALTRTPQGGGRDTRYFKLGAGELTGLRREQMFSGTGQRVKFQLRRPAGTFDFEGSFAAGKGAGAFTFTADEVFIVTMRQNGYGEALKRNLFGFAIGNFGGDVAAQFSALGLESPTPEQMGQLSTHAISAGFIRELQSLGYEPRSIDQLISLRKHGASAAYVRALMAAGFERPTLEQLISLRTHGVSLQFVEELRKLGYEPRSVQQLISLRQHGASVEFIKTVAALGYERPTLDQLISMRIHGVTPRFIEELKSLGYERVPLNQLISMKIQGITLDFIRELRAQGYANVSLSRLFDVRMFGMPVEFLKHLPDGGEGGRAAVEWLIKFYGRGTPRAWMFRRGSEDVGGHSSEVSTGQLPGLTESQVFSDGVPVRFRLIRGAQSLDCVGWFKGGFGAGTCEAARR
jgi:hypothetical protein